MLDETKLDNWSLEELKKANATAHSMVDQALAHQTEKWGLQLHDPLYWLAILTEEVGEVAAEIQSEYPVSVERIAAYRHELAQVAAVAIAALACTLYKNAMHHKTLELANQQPKGPTQSISLMPTDSTQ